VQTYQHRVLAYHELTGSPSKDVYELHPRAFRAHVETSRMLGAMRGIVSEFTFDDAHVSQIEIAGSILSEAGMCGHFFAPTAWVGRRPNVATWHDLRMLCDAGHYVSSHGNTHALLTQCSAHQLKHELIRSREMLEQKLGIAVDSISLPGGRWNPAVADACVAAGYSSLYTSQPALAPVMIETAFGPLRVVGRLAVRRTMPVSFISRYLNGDPITYTQLVVGFHLRKSIRSLIGDSRYQSVWRHLLRSPLHNVTHDIKSSF
jgi:hypothetical protein